MVEILLLLLLLLVVTDFYLHLWNLLWKNLHLVVEDSQGSMTEAEGSQIPRGDVLEENRLAEAEDSQEGPLTMEAEDSKAMDVMEDNRPEAEDSQEGPLTTEAEDSQDYWKEKLVEREYFKKMIHLYDHYQLQDSQGSLEPMKKTLI